MPPRSLVDRHERFRPRTWTPLWVLKPPARAPTVPITPDLVLAAPPREASWPESCSLCGFSEADHGAVFREDVRVRRASTTPRRVRRSPAPQLKVQDVTAWEEGASAPNAKRPKNKRELRRAAPFNPQRRAAAVSHRRGQKRKLEKTRDGVKEIEIERGSRLRYGCASPYRARKPSAPVGRSGCSPGKDPAR